MNRDHSIPSLIAEVRRLWGMRSIDPYDRYACEKLAEVLFDTYQEQHPIATPERGRALLQMIEAGFPTPRLTAAYFENLERTLEDKQRPQVPGQVVLGLGTSRCGSSQTTAAATTSASVIRPLTRFRNARNGRNRPHLGSRLPSNPEKHYHSRQFGVHPGNLGCLHAMHRSRKALNQNCQHGLVSHRPLVI